MTTPAKVWLYSAVDALACAMHQPTGHAQADVLDWRTCQQDAADWLDQILPVIRAGLAAELRDASLQVMRDAAVLDHPTVRGIAVGLNQAAIIIDNHDDAPVPEGGY